jgi:hypothetical protein
MAGIIFLLEKIRHREKARQGQEVPSALVRIADLCSQSYRLLVPRVNFLTFFLLLPRATVRLAFGAAFLRAARFAALRSGLAAFFVFAMAVSSLLLNKIS